MRPLASRRFLGTRRSRPAAQRALLVFAALVLLLANSLVSAIRPARAVAPFVDVPPTHEASAAINALYDRGIIRGYPTDPPTFGPDDFSLRAQMAALIGRAMAWDTGGNNPFTDRCIPQGCIDDELWGYVAALASRDVAKGYDPTTYAPFDNVLKQQVILFIARARVNTGAWTQQPANPALYANSAASAADASDIATYVYYAGAPPDAPAALGQDWGAYATDATRGWFARALWQAYPEGRGTPVPGQTPTPSPSPSASPSPSPSVEPGPAWQRPAANASWLTTMNAYRALAGLAAVTEDASQTADCIKHAEYIVKQGELAHAENPASPYYSDDGNRAAQQSNLGAGTGPPPAQRESVERFIGSVFHAVWPFSPRLQSSGYGEYSQASGVPNYTYGFCLNVIRGLTGPASYPVMFPAVDGVQPFLVAPLAGEAPDPLSSCSGYSNPVGGVVLLQVSDTVTSATGALKAADGTPLESCVYDGTNYTHPTPGFQDSGRSILTSAHMVVLIPKQQLTAATVYKVSFTVNGTDYAWSFTTARESQAIR